MRLTDLDRLLRRHGLTLDHVTGSHRVYRDRQGRRLVAALHPGRELHRGEVARVQRDLSRLLAREDG